VTDLLTPARTDEDTQPPRPLRTPTPDDPAVAAPDGPWVAIVANPFSGAGANHLRVARLVEALRREGLDSRVLWDPGVRATVLSDQRLKENCRCIVAAGGDGTVGDVINERRDLPVAMLPVGNENLFARQFGYGRPTALARMIAAGRTRRIDLGRVHHSYNRHVFSLMVSAGLDAEVVHRVANWRMDGEGLRRVTRLSYVRPTLAALRGYDYPPLTLEADGQTITGTHVLVFNLPQYAARLGFAPDAISDDGLMDWVVFEKPGPLRIGAYMLSVALGRHRRRRDVHHGRAARLAIRSESPVPVQVDGDPAGRTPVQIEVLPCAVDVIAR